MQFKARRKKRIFYGQADRKGGGAKKISLFLDEN